MLDIKAGNKVLKYIRLFFSSYKDEYQKHIIKATVSYLINYYKLLCVSLLNGTNKIVAISLIEHIGDIIANEPITRKVRKKHSDSIIIWFVRKPYIDLVKYNPAINKVFTVYCLTSWIWISKKFHFKAMYDLHFNGRTCTVCQLPLKKENIDDSINGTNYFDYGGLLKAICLQNKIEIEDTKPKMYIPTKFLIQSEQYKPKGKYIVIHCLSNEAIKDWDGEKWNQLAKHLTSKEKLHIVEIGTMNVIKNDSDYYHNLCGKISLLQSAAIIKRADLFIGIDSGPAQMANALETPGLILLGEYYYGMKNYNPYSGNYGSLINCQIINSPGLVKNISVNSVLKGVREFMQFNPML